MKLSLLYIYKVNDRLFDFLVEYARKNKKTVELIILDDLNSELRFVNKISSNISILKFPRVSKGFLYNRGIRYAKSNTVGIIQSYFTFDNFFLSKLDKSFSNENKNFFLSSSFPYERLNVSNSLLLPNDILLSELVNYNNCNFLLNKKIINNEGLFFDETMDYICMFDLMLRARSFNFLSIPSETKLVCPRKTNNTYFNLGKDLSILLFKYKKRRYRFICFLISNFFHHPIIVSKLFFGFVARYFSSKVYIFLRNTISKLNSIWIKFCRKYRIYKLLYFPTELSIEPTNYCNAHCPLCPTGSNKLKRAKGYLDFELFKKIIDQSKYFLQRVVLWNLGEPFLNPDIYSMIQYAKKNGVKIISSTNGYAFYSRSSVNLLIESGLDSVIVAADGANVKTFSKYRKGVDYLKSIEGLKYLRDEKKRLKKIEPIVYMQLILMKQTEGEVKEVSKLAKLLNAEFCIKYLSLEMVDTENKKDFLPNDTNKSVYNIINQKAKLKRHETNSPCVAWDGMVINWDGSVNPCIFDYYGKIIIGDVGNMSLIKIWRSKKLRNLRRNILENRKNISICQRCPINENYSELYYL